MGNCIIRECLIIYFPGDPDNNNNNNNNNIVLLRLKSRKRLKRVILFIGNNIKSFTFLKLLGKFFKCAIV